MLSVSEAQQRILAHFHPVGTELCPLQQAAGRILAEDILAGTDLPPFSNSSVDGFALHAADAADQLNFPVVADIRAGQAELPVLEHGQAARIMTGAPLPQGADAVVMVEDTDYQERLPGSPAPRAVSLHSAPQPGLNVRNRGADLQRGERVLQAPCRLRAQEIGLLAMLGVPRVAAYRRPRLALLSTGSELLPPSEPLTSGKIHDTNSYTLNVLTEQAGAEVLALGIAADNRAEVYACLEKAVDAKADLILTSAGVSVGAYDYVKPALEAQGRLEFWQVNMRPGKPLAFGDYRGIPFFGLPGNPVSAFVGFIIFVRPALEILGGSGWLERPRRTARLAEAVESDGRETFLRGIVRDENGVPTARLAGHQGSGNLFALVQANALLILPSGVKSLPANSEIEICPIE
jgi:molybdopterin molybdotransferase